MTMTEHDETTDQPAALVPVDGPPPDPHIERRTAAIEAAAEAALAMPGMPGRDEFLTLAMTAKMLSLSGAAPEPVRESPYVAFHVAMVGRDLGISPSAAINLIDVIKSKGGQYQLSLSPQLLNGQIRRLGLGSIRPRERTETRCVAIAYGPDGTELGESEFTWEDARMAGLVGRECQPGQHKAQGDKGCGCNQGYRTYPKRMLWWRASGFAADDFFPEAGLGLYTAEELGALVDEEGRAIDPMNVELPNGYDDPKAIEQAKRDAADPRADATDLYHLWLRMRSLPADEAADLKAKWAQLEKLAGVGVYRLSASQYRVAQSMVAGQEKKAKARAGYDVGAATLATERALQTHIVRLLSPPWAVPLGPPTPDGAGGAPTPDAAPHGPDTAARGEVDAPLTDEQVVRLEQDAGAAAVDEELERVKAMKPGEVRQALEALGKPTDGKPDDLRKRLTITLLKDRIAKQQAGE